MSHLFDSSAQAVVVPISQASQRSTGGWCYLIFGAVLVEQQAVIVPQLCPNVLLITRFALPRPDMSFTVILNITSKLPEQIGLRTRFTFSRPA